MAAITPTQLRRFKTSHLILLAIVFAELLTAIANTIQSYLWYGYLSPSLLMIGAIDALVVSIPVASMIIYLARSADDLSKTNERLQQEILHRRQAEKLVLERSMELEASYHSLRGEMDERHRAEQEVAATAKHFQSLIENALDIITILNSDGSVRYESPSVERILGYRPEDMLGRSVFDYIHPEDSTKVGEVFNRVVQEPGRNDAVELRFRHKDGTWRIIEAVGKSLTRDDGEMIVIVNSRDITDRKQLEDELIRAQKLESLGILAGGIAHDFNNLLVSILGNVSLALLDAKPGSATLRQLQLAEKASLRAQGLTLQLLTFSRGGDPVKKVINLGPVVREATEFSLRGSRVTCTVELAEDLWPVDADAGQIAQVVNNLVLNADQAMPMGGAVSIRLENLDPSALAVPSLPSGRYVRLSVRDTGIGIPGEHISKVFDPYFTTKQKGSGLGLAVTYAIIRKHGGHISVDSAPGAGTVFTIHLPAADALPAEPPPDEGRIFSGRGAILVMDDEHDVRLTVESMLRRLGYSVELAENGEQAVEQYRKALRSRPFDAVIMDLTVPGGMDGRETIVRLREIDPRVRAIVSSGYANDPVMADHAAYGFAGVVTKPFRLKELSAAVAAVLHK